MDWLALVVGLAIGALVGWLIARASASAARAAAELRQQEVMAKREEISALSDKLSRAENALTESRTQLTETEKRRAEELQLLKDAKDALSNTFKALAAEALRTNNQEFLNLAGQVVTPLSDSLEKMDKQIQNLEGARREAYGTITEQVTSLIATQKELRTETANLVKALRAPAVRGRWGELQLKRVVELAGMLDHCDFFTQETVDSEEGRLRPDMRVQLAGGRSIVVDAKVPLQAYLDSLEAPSDESRADKLRDHARQVRDHITKLGAKAYWDTIQPTPEFVVMFIPGEVFYSAALEQDPSLIERGVDDGVILATPTMLIALLKSVAYGWREERLAENAERISELGRELHERIATLAEHFGKVGLNLGHAVGAYNDAVGSIENRVLVTARRFKELGVASKKEIKELEPVDRAPRELTPPADIDPKPN